MSRTFFQKAFLFTGIFFLLYCLLLILIGQCMSISFGSQFYYPEGGAGHSQLRFQEVKSQKHIDLLFIGSSHAYRNYDPRIFNQEQKAAFNLGSTAQTPIQTWEILQHLPHHLLPKRLIIDFYLPLFYNEGIESSIDLLANTDFYPMRWSEHYDVKWYNALLYRTLSQKLLDLQPKKNPERIGHDQYITGGYVQSHQSFDARHQTPKVSGIINQSQVNALQNIVLWANDRKIKWMIVQSPIFSSHEAAKYENLPLALQEIIPKEKFINGQSAVRLALKNFIDFDHLSTAGVQDYNSWLMDTLKKKHFFD